MDSDEPQKPQIGSDWLRKVSNNPDGTRYGSEVPRIHSPLNDLPTKGNDLIDFASSVGLEFVPWQKWLAVQAHKYDPVTQRWAHPLITAVLSRQNGKTTFMKARILMGLFEWKHPLQIGTAHRLTTSLETFRDLVQIIEENEDLAKKVKRIRWAHGSEEIELDSKFGGGRYMVKAGAAAARGISKPEAVHIDEGRENKDESAWASLRYTMMAAENPQQWVYSSAGDSHSIILNQLRERGLTAAAGGNDDIGYFEWSSPYHPIDDSPAFWDGVAMANPSLNYTINENNIRAVLNDPPDVVRTEVLSQWVATISGAIPQESFAQCGDDSLELDPEKTTWLGLDCSPDRKNAALVAAQRIDEDKFFIKLLHTWHNDVSLDDKAIAGELAQYARQYPTEIVAYSKKTASMIAARLYPAGIPIADIDGALYGQACDELLGAITSKRLRHKNQAELTKQMIAAARLPQGDGGWVIGRRASGSVVTACVAAALVTHYATRPETDLDVAFG